MMRVMLMKDYLNEQIDFEKIDLARLGTLIKSTSETKDTHLARIRSKFEQTSDHFDEVLAFLMQAKLVKIKNGKVFLLRKINIQDKGVFSQVIIDTLFDKRLKIKYDLSWFIGFFIFKNNNYWFLPDRKLRLKTSGIRNFLINLRFLKYDLAEDCYFVSTEYLRYVDEMLDKNTLTPLQLSKKLLRITVLGEAAEVAVIKYEKKRLKGFLDLLPLVKQVSKEKVNAGYDIKSFSGNPTLKNPIPRYIEVKAVSPEDYKFYWSKNELRASKTLGDQYYLYLVPVKGNKVFDIKNLVIIQNPHRSIFEDKENWNQDIELMSFSTERYGLDKKINPK